MLDIIFGRENLGNKVKQFHLDSRAYFSIHKQPEWFEDEFVKRFLKTVDGTEVLFQEALKDYRGKGISTEMISTGCKTLCCIYYNPDQIFNASMMGDNCLPFLMEIANKQDITVVLEHFGIFPKESFSSGLVSSSGCIIHNYDEYEDLFSAWCETTEEDDYLDRIGAIGL